MYPGIYDYLYIPNDLKKYEIPRYFTPLNSSYFLFVLSGMSKLLCFEVRG